MMKAAEMHSKMYSQIALCSSAITYHSCNGKCLPAEWEQSFSRATAVLCTALLPSLRMPIKRGTAPAASSLSQSAVTGTQYSQVDASCIVLLEMYAGNADAARPCVLPAVTICSLTDESVAILLRARAALA